MTNQAPLIQLLSEALYEDPDLITQQVELIIDTLAAAEPGSTQAFAKQFNEREAALILTEMRQNQVEIVAWFIRQYQQALQRRYSPTDESNT